MPVISAMHIIVAMFLSMVLHIFVVIVAIFMIFIVISVIFSALNSAYKENEGKEKKNKIFVTVHLINLTTEKLIYSKIFIKNENKYYN
jgi:hypothetical protein